MELDAVLPTVNASLITMAVNESFISAMIAQYLANDHIFSPHIEILIISLYSILVVTGTVTNLSVIAVIVANRELRTGSNLLILNLNLSDLGVSIIVGPLTLMNVLRRTWTYGGALCRLAPIVQGLQIFVSALTVSVIALDRMLRITSLRGSVRPGQGTKSVLITTSIVWLIALALVVPVGLNNEVITVGDPKIVLLSTCAETWSRRARTVYTMVTLISQLLVPTMTLFVSYVRISSYLNRRTYQQTSINLPQLSPRIRAAEESSWLDRSLSMAPEGVPNVAIERNDELSNESAVARGCRLQNACFLFPMARMVRVNRRNRKAVLVLIAIWLSFSVSWLPWNLFNMYVDFVQKIDLEPDQFNLFFISCHLIAISSPTSNAILYGWLNTSIRVELLAGKDKFRAAVVKLASFLDPFPNPIPIAAV